MKKRFMLENLDCAHCAAKMEAAISELEGVSSAGVNFINKTFTLEAADNIFDSVLERAVKTAGKIEPKCKIVLESAEHTEHKRTVIRIIAAALLCAAAFILPTDSIRVALFVAAYIVIGYDVLWTALRNILHGRVFDEQFLMSLATIGAFCTSKYLEAVAVMLFYQLGELFQSIAVGRSRSSIASLLDIRPDYAVVLREGNEQRVSPEEVELGEVIIVKPGERIPLDGEVISGMASVNTSALTGESLPVDVAPGDNVISGSVDLTGVLKIEVKSNYQDSTISRILELVEHSTEKKARVEGFITRFARYYTPCVVIGSLLLAVIPPLVFGLQWSTWFNRALVFLVVSCPCALVISVPLSFFGGIGRASRDGILIKGANYLEALAGIDTVAFDKTGTITKGTFAVEAIHPEQISEAELLDIAAAAESYSSHPLAQCVTAAHRGHIEKARIGEISELAGLGISAVIDGSKYYVGNGKLMDSINAQWHECHISGTIIHIASEQEYLGHIVINDTVKPEAAEAVSSLRQLGISKTVMLTGDAQPVAERVRAAVGIDSVMASLLPADKVKCVEQLLAEGRRVAFVGDGINDAPVLTMANVGIAMGAMGSDAAIESADIVLMDDNPERLPQAIRTARRTMRIVRQNIFFALAVKAITLILGACGIAGIWIAVFGDVGVMVLAILNAMRTLLQHRD